MEAVSKNNVDAVKLLLENGADVNYTNTFGATALHEGVRYNSHEALTYFLEEDIDHSLKDRKGRNVLHYAAQYADLKTLSILESGRLYGIDAEDTDYSKRTPIEYAETRQQEEKARGLNTLNSKWLVAFGSLLESLLAFKTPKSVPSLSESIDGGFPSKDTILDALQHFQIDDFERMADLAEGGKAPQAKGAMGPIMA